MRILLCRVPKTVLDWSVRLRSGSPGTVPTGVTHDFDNSHPHDPLVPDPVVDTSQVPSVSEPLSQLTKPLLLLSDVIVFKHKHMWKTTRGLFSLQAERTTYSIRGGVCCYGIRVTFFSGRFDRCTVGHGPSDQDFTTTTSKVGRQGWCLPSHEPR